MSLVAPWNLLWLLLLVPVIVFFYLLKLRRREMVISSVLLWNHLVKDVQANAPFQKLKMVSSMGSGDRIMVLLATSRTHRLTGLTGDKNELRRATNQAEARDTTTNLRDALLLAVSVAGQHPGSRVYILSDGCFPETEELNTRGASLEYVKIGSRSDNVGIVAMDVRRSFNDKGGYQMFLAVRNFSDEPKKCNLEFYRNDALIDVRPLELPAADKTEGFSEKAEVLGNIPETTGILRARLDIDDDLPIDNQAYTQLSTRSDLNVLLVSDGDLYLEKALNVDPRVHLSVVTPGAYTGQADFDVVVFENLGPRKVGPGAHLYINCGGPTAPVEIQGKVTNATVVDWERAHPVMRYVNLTRLQMQEALKADLRSWGVKLAENESGVVIAVGEKGGAKSGYIGFPLLKSDFPLKVAFPILMNNMVQWLAARPGRTEGLQIRAGQAAPIEVPATLTDAVVTDPEGQKHPVRPDGRLLYYPDTETAGVYTATGPKFRREFAVNLLSRDESATKPRDKLQFGKRPVLAGTGAVRTASEVWRWLLLLALAVLGVEWWVYHRRI